MKANEKNKKAAKGGFVKVKIINQVVYIDAKNARGERTQLEIALVFDSKAEAELVKFAFGISKEKLIDAISAGAKLTKADAGRALDLTMELIRKKLKVVFGGKGQ